MKDKYKSKIIISISGAVIGAVCTYFEGKSCLLYTSDAADEL